jgi:beta-phosphoglucomutase-like phosphatase (HAD superfamily)
MRQSSQTPEPLTALIPAEAILIDLDGTLIDTAPDLAGATNRMLGFFGMAKSLNRG